MTLINALAQMVSSYPSGISKTSISKMEKQLPVFQNFNLFSPFGFSASWQVVLIFWTDHALTTELFWRGVKVNRVTVKHKWSRGPYQVFVLLTHSLKAIC